MNEQHVNRFNRLKPGLLVFGRAFRRLRLRRLRVFIAVGSVVAIVLLAILADYIIYRGEIHAGVSISGQSVSGLTRDEASARITALVDEARKSEITLVSGERAWPVFADDVGTEFDVAAAVSAAMDVSRESNFFVDLGRRLKLYFSDFDAPLEGTVDSAKMEGVLAKVAAELDEAPVNAGLAMERGEIVVIEGRNGQTVDRAALGKMVESLVLTLRGGEIPVPLVVQEPAVQAEDTQPAVEQAKTMMNAAVLLRRGDKTWSLTPQQLVTYVDFTPLREDDASTLKPYLSPGKMAPFFAQIGDQVAKEPTDAQIDTDGDKAWVVPGVPGERLDPVKTAEALTAAALETSGRTAEVAVVSTEPAFTTEEAEALGIKDKLASFTTEWVGSRNRQVNVRITTEYASDVMLAPGEEYDFDKQIGPRTAARGYKTAPGIVGPGKLEDVFGGGICQVSTTLFNAVFFAGLEVTERRNHSIYIDHYPKGRDATVNAGGPNLRFKNDTSHHILIKGISDGITTTFTIYGTSEGRKVSYTTSDFYNWVGRSEVTIPTKALPAGTSVVRLSGQSGRQVKVVRTVTLPNGTVVHEDTFVSTFPMVPRQVEVGIGTPTPKPTAPPSNTTTTNPTPTTTVPPPATTTTTGAQATNF